MHSQVEIEWLAAEPATTMLRDAGEHVLAEADEWAEETQTAESAAGEYASSIFKYVLKAYDGMDRNAEVFERVTSKKDYDVVVGDETYELWEPLVKKPERLRCPFVMIYDFVGFDAPRAGLIEKLGSYYFNRMWVSSDRKLFAESSRHRALFVGEPDDIPDAELGLMLPNRKTHAMNHYDFIGYVLTFDPGAFANGDEIRSSLGYDRSPMILVTVGGTSIGRPLLELSAKAFPLIKEEIPDVRMVMACGPRIDPGSVEVPLGWEDLEILGYVPRLYEYMAISDLAIVQGGGTTTLELTALGRPFLYFPLHGHFEQEIAVSSRLQRHRAGIRMQFADTTPEALAREAVTRMRERPSTPPLRTDGARVAAERILQAVAV
jgi:hypothetical protein